MNAEPDLRVTRLDPADSATGDLEECLWLADLNVLAEHHTLPLTSHSFYLAHDSSATWGTPGAPQLRSLLVVRNHWAGTYRLEIAEHAQLAFAQNWLINRGCPPEGIALRDGDFLQAADARTRELEERIRHSGVRYQILETFTSDDDPAESWTLVRDTQAQQLPVHLFLEETDYTRGVYTVREGAFPEESAAQNWLDKRNCPLPPVPQETTPPPRTQAALARSTSGRRTLPLAGGEADLRGPDAQPIARRPR